MVSVRTRLTLSNIGLLALALLVFAVATRALIGQVLWSKLDQMLTTQAERPVERFSRGGPFEQQFHPPPASEIGAPLPPRVWHERAPEEGEPLWSEAGLRAAQDGVELHWDWIPDDGQGYPLRVRTQRLVVQGELIVVQTAVATHPTQSVLDSVTYALVLLLPVLILMASLGGLWLTRRALAPVRALTEAASKIEVERLTERLPEPGGNDELDELTRMLNRSLSQLDDAFTRQKQFTSHASHELRTPLATIKTALGLLRRSDLPTALRNEALASADDATDRASRLVTDLLFLARSQNGALPVRLAELDVAATLQPVVPLPALLRVPHALKVHTDRDLLLRLVGNLVSNALRHTPPEGQVIVEAHQQGSGIVVSVTDTGCGIAPEHLEKLGQPFYRPDTARGRDDGGVGLGISICHAIVARLGGSLTFRSTPGQGTTATVTLPNLLG